MSNLKAFLVLVWIGLAGIIAAHLIPYNWVHHGPTLCLWKRFLGHECWGCGSTRAMYHLLRGEFAEAWGYNHLIVVVVPLATVLCFRWLRGIRAK